MHSRLLGCLAALVLASTYASCVWAQPPERARVRGGRESGDAVRRGGPGGPGQFGRENGAGPRGGMADLMRLLPVFTALDTDQDGVISAVEIKNATASLQQLDKNGDGSLDEQELRPDLRALREAGARFGPAGTGQGGPGARPDFSGQRRGQRYDESGVGRAAEREAADRVAAMVARMMESDSNGDGKLEKDELPERLLARLAEADTDNDGYATREELLALAKQEFRPDGGPSQDMLTRLMEQSDSDQDGKLSRDEVPDRLLERFDQIDANGDGSIDQRELSGAIQRGRSRSGSPPESNRR